MHCTVSSLSCQSCSMGEELQMAKSRLRIPYLCAREPVCTAEHFRNWPTRQKWPRIVDTPLTSVESRLQPLFFFSLMSAFFGQDNEQDSFLKHDPEADRTYIDIELLDFTLRTDATVIASVLPKLCDRKKGSGRSQRCLAGEEEILRSALEDVGSE